LECMSPERLSVEELFKYHRKLAGSHDLLERLKVLWVAAQLAARLEWRSDAEIAELERSLIVERIRAGMRRARMEGVRLGRAPHNIDRAAIVRDRLSGMSLTQVAKRHRVSRATVVRLVREASRSQVTVAA
jgi:DNA invertase Pin-like site-specific DNA recombinase